MAVPGGASLDHACQLGAPLYGPCQWRSRAEPRWTMLDSWGPYWYLSVRGAAGNHDLDTRPCNGRQRVFMPRASTGTPNFCVVLASTLTPNFSQELQWATAPGHATASTRACDSESNAGGSSGPPAKSHQTDNVCA